MTLPFSKNQARKLGDRLKTAEVPLDGDIVMLEELLTAYDEVLSAAVERVWSGLGVTVSSRIKNTGTIIEKLRRSSGSQLHTIQDLAGMRIVVGGSDRTVQDALVARLVALFADPIRPPKIFDRRVNPSHGYRAVHVVVHVNDIPIEIQVRTEWQHVWAEFFEKLADRLGRQIRYGERASVDNLRLGSTRSSEKLLNDLQHLADDVVDLGHLCADLISSIEDDYARGVRGQEQAAYLAKVRTIIGTVTEMLDLLVAGAKSGKVTP